MMCDNLSLVPVRPLLLIIARVYNKEEGECPTRV